MKYLSLITALITAGTVGAQASLVYDFDGGAGLDGFNATLGTAPAGWTGHGNVAKVTSGAGWSSPLLKEFSWGPGGGNPNQQVEMQNMAWGDMDFNEARFQFDVAVDDSSFANLGAGQWYQLFLIGNSDGPAGWTQTQVIDGWHEPGYGLKTWHFDVPFSFMGWAAGDSWFQVFVGLNGGTPVTWSIDNVVATLVPEPTSFALAGLGALALLISRRRN